MNAQKWKIYNANGSLFATIPASEMSVDSIKKWLGELQITRISIPAMEVYTTLHNDF